MGLHTRSLTHIHCYGVTRHSFTAPKTPLGPAHSSLLPPTPAPLILPPAPESCLFQNVPELESQCVAFTDWLLPLGHVHLRFLRVFRGLMAFSLALRDTASSGCSVHHLGDIISAASSPAVSQRCSPDRPNMPVLPPPTAARGRPDSGPRASAPCSREHQRQRAQTFGGLDGLRPPPPLPEMGVTTAAFPGHANVRPETFQKSLRYATREGSPRYSIHLAKNNPAAIYDHRFHKKILTF